MCSSDLSGDLRRGQPALLIHGGRLDAGEVLPRFMQEAGAIPEDVRDLICTKIREHLLERRDVKSKRRQVRREDWQKRGAGQAGNGSGQQHPVDPEKPSRE